MPADPKNLSHLGLSPAARFAPAPPLSSIVAPRIAVDALAVCHDGLFVNSIEKNAGRDQRINPHCVELLCDITLPISPKIWKPSERLKSSQALTPLWSGQLRAIGPYCPPEPARPAVQSLHFTPEPSQRRYAPRRGGGLANAHRRFLCVCAPSCAAFALRYKRAGEPFRLRVVS